MASFALCFPASARASVARPARIYCGNPERQAHRGSRPRTEANHWRPAAGPGASTTGGARSLSAGLPALYQRLRTAGTSAGAVPRRLAMARRGDARFAGGSADATGCAPSNADRRRQRPSHPATILTSSRFGEVSDQRFRLSRSLPV